MEDIRISLSAEGPENQLSVVRVDGVIDTTTSAKLEEVLNSLIEQSRYKIIIDLGGVEYISSAGWGIFISNIREIRLNSGDLKLARMIPEVHEVFELLEFDTILKAFDSLEAARQDFGMGTVAKLEETIHIEKEFEKKRAEVAAQGKSNEPLDVMEEPTAESQILRLIKDNPFLGIFGIRSELRSEDYGMLKLSYWQIYTILRRHHLTSKKKRWRYSRKEKFVERYGEDTSSLSSESHP